MNVTSLYWRQLYLYLKRERRRQMRARVRLAAKQVDGLPTAAPARSGGKRRLSPSWRSTPF